MVVLVSLFLKIRNLRKNLFFKQKENERVIKGKYMYIVIANRWLWRRRKFGPSLEDCLVREIRKKLTIVGMSSMDVLQRRSVKIIIQIMKPLFEIEILKAKFHKVRVQISWIQMRMRCTLAAKHGKVEIMENYWDKMLGLMQMRASELSNQKML